MICDHCGGQHPPADCGVKAATRRILEGYVPRGQTRGETCPSCGKDGGWHWWPPGTAQSFKCDCGAVVLAGSGKADQEEPNG